MTGTRLVALAGVIVIAAVAPASAAVPSGNLLANPGGEDAPGASDTSTVFVPGWTTTGSFTAVAYGTPGFHGPVEGGGANYFTGGDGSEVAQASQTFDVSADAGLIDECRVSAKATGWFGGFEAQNDRAGADVAFLAADGSSLGSIQTGFPTAADRGGLTRFFTYSRTGQVPPGTRRISFSVTAQRTDGTYNDGYADNLSLSLEEKPPPAGGVAHIPQAGRSVVVRRVRGTVTSSYTITLHLVPGLCIGEDDIKEALDAITLLLPGEPEIDATRGEVALTAAQDASGAAETALFSRGAFKIAQAPAAQPVTELTMTGGEFAKCRGRGRGSARVARRLWGNGKGRFRTRGRYSSATLQQGTWRTEDRCDGTMTSVPRSARGSRVVVRDLVRRRNVTLRAGQSYLARPRR